MSDIEVGSEMHEAAVELLEAAERYWRLYQKSRSQGGGAIVWLDDSKGNTVIFTRGEYRHQLMANIEFPGPTKHFAHATTDREFEGEFGSRTPDGLTG